jgi:hypothetical protein
MEKQNENEMKYLSFSETKKSFHSPIKFGTMHGHALNQRSLISNTTFKSV